jgi:hypothetical protein
MYRRWIDKDLLDLRPVSLFVPLFLLAVPVWLHSAAGDSLLVNAAVVICAVPSTAGFAFFFWRASRVYRAGLIRSSRMYEQRTRYALPPEYADTEDAMLAKRREARRATPPPR